MVAKQGAAGPLGKPDAAGGCLFFAKCTCKLVVGLGRSAFGALPPSTLALKFHPPSLPPSPSPSPFPPSPFQILPLNHGDRRDEESIRVSGWKTSLAIVLPSLLVHRFCQPPSHSLASAASTFILDWDVHGCRDAPRLSLWSPATGLSPFAPWILYQATTHPASDTRSYFRQLLTRRLVSDSLNLYPRVNQCFPLDEQPATYRSPYPDPPGSTTTASFSHLVNNASDILAVPVTSPSIPLLELCLPLDFEPAIPMCDIR